MTETRLLDKVVVIGAGQMGSGIAHGFAVTGAEVTVVDVDRQALDRCAAVIARTLADGVRLGKLKEEEKRAALRRIASTTEIEHAFDGAGLAVETASERIDVKIDIARTAARALPRDAIIATNTSALSITEIAAATDCPDRVVGMHFFNPVPKMKLVEVIRGLATSDDTVARIRAIAERLGKTSIIVNEAPGFTTSRMSALLGNEAMYMLMEGVASAEDIDTALRMGLNHPMGPLELGDLTGWDTRLSVLEYLHRSLGEKYRPCPLIIKMVKSGRVGRKVGRGVYEYVDGQKMPNSGLTGR